MRFVEKHWYNSSFTLLTLLLLPFSWLFRGVVFLRYFFYKMNKPNKLPVPIIVVGNITVGGTGKTPFVIWLAEFLKSKGYKPGIVSRGYGGSKQKHPILIDKNSSVIDVGDEALLLAKRTNCPVAVSINRVLAVKKLIEVNCNIIISDDGLQHYRLPRQLEIAIIDGVRQFGNKQMLPAGPLREPISRLKKVNFKIWHGNQASQEEFSMHLQTNNVVSLLNHENKISWNDFKSKTVHAVAAIGNPARFFSMLRAQGVNVIEHAFPDHYHFKKSDLQFNDTFPILMTEKDSVKCVELANDKMWFVPVDAVFSKKLSQNLFQAIDLI